MPEVENIHPIEIPLCMIFDMHPNDSSKYLNITNAFYPIGVIVSALLFGELLTLGYSWRSIFLITATMALVVGLILNSSKFPDQKNQKSFSWNLIINILFLRGFRKYGFAIFLAAGIESAFTFWSRSYVEIYLQELPRAGAIAVVIFSCGMAFGRFLATRLSNKVSPKILMNRVQELAREISNSYKDSKPILIGVLNGAFIFMADLVRNIEIEFQPDSSS